jgi:dihydrofolate reductase
MGKVIERTLVSLDGITGDPHVWALSYFDKAAQDDALAELMASEAMLMGRRTYAIFAKLWPSRTGAYFDQINAMKKYVFSSDLRNADWRNTSIIRGDVVRSRN